MNKMDTNEHEYGVSGAALDALIQQVLGASYEVANHLGHGFLENVYRRALLEELEMRGIAAREEVSFKVRYKGREVGTYVADLVVGGVLIVELKAVEDLAPAHQGQVLNYLRASGLRAGLLLNFGKPRVQAKRLVL